MTDPKELFSAGRLLARMKAKYMKAILTAFSPVDSPGLGTIGVTEHGVLMIDWDFIAAVAAAHPSGTEAAECVGGLLVHEAFHVLLDHCKRSKQARRDPALGNMADDCSFNNAVWDMGLRLPGGGPTITPDHPLHGVYPEDYGWPRGETSDQYYERFKKLPPKPKQSGNGGKGDAQGQGHAGAGGAGAPSEPNDASGGGGSGGDADHAQPGKGSSNAAQKPKTGGGFCGSCAGRAMPNEPGKDHKGARAPAEMQRLARQVAQAIREEATANRGTVPAFLQRWAEEMLTPAEVPWEQELAMITRNAIAWRANAADHKYDAPSRRQAGIGFGPGKPILPRFRMPVPNVTVILDTSGSMGTDELSVAGREVNGILKAVGANITFVTCDAQVHGIHKVRTLKEALARLAGGGGTDMQPAIAACMKLRPRPEVIVCLTDLMIGDPGPQPPGVKMVWVGVGTYATKEHAPPWGKTIIIKNDKQKGSAA